VAAPAAKLKAQAQAKASKAAQQEEARRRRRLWRRRRRLVEASAQVMVQAKQEGDLAHEDLRHAMTQQESEILYAGYMLRCEAQTIAQTEVRRSNDPRTGSKAKDAMATARIYAPRIPGSTY
jgi:hypothetical protein